MVRIVGQLTVAGVKAEPDAQTVRMQIEMQINLRKAVTIGFVMRRVPGSPSMMCPSLR